MATFDQYRGTALRLLNSITGHGQRFTDLLDRVSTIRQEGEGVPGWYLDLERANDDLMRALHMASLKAVVRQGG